MPIKMSITHPGSSLANILNQAIESIKAKTPVLYSPMVSYAFNPELCTVSILNGKFGLSYNISDKIRADGMGGCTDFQRFLIVMSAVHMNYCLIHTETLPYPTSNPEATNVVNPFEALGLDLGVPYRYIMHSSTNMKTGVPVNTAVLIPQFEVKVQGEIPQDMKTPQRLIDYNSIVGHFKNGYRFIKHSSYADGRGTRIGHRIRGQTHTVPYDPKNPLNPEIKPFSSRWQAHVAGKIRFNMRKYGTIKSPACYTTVELGAVEFTFEASNTEIDFENAILNAGFKSVEEYNARYEAPPAQSSSSVEPPAQSSSSVEPHSQQAQIPKAQMPRAQMPNAQMPRAQMPNASAIEDDEDDENPIN
jgi:hypothetical protein